MGREPNSVYGLDGNWSYHYLSLQRSFLKENRLTVMLAAQNPFEHCNVYKQRIVQGDYRSIERTKRRPQMFGIRVSYRFGSLKTQVKKADRSIENDDVVGGIKQQGTSNN